MDGKIFVLLEDLVVHKKSRAEKLHLWTPFVCEIFFRRLVINDGIP